ncbi:MAG: acyl-CoA thioesterase [Gemmatimonadota bacterium]|nr:acyl-CoA thioesterase [Gemmatimonadota bacterium]
MPQTETTTLHRVNYSEVDAMGVAYHGNYIVWLDVARTEHIRTGGMSYAEMERRGFRLVVGELSIRYLAPARYDDEVRVCCWVGELGSRRVLFRYRVERVSDGERLAAASTAMFVLSESMRPTRLPAEILTLLRPIPAPAE